MATANEIQQRALTGFDKLAADDPKVYADQLYANAVEAIERQSGDRAREINEHTFGRGLGLSTITRDLQMAREKEVLDAKTKARREADLAARQATLSALGQAAGAASQDLTRQQSSAQFQANQQMQRKQLGQQSDIANMNALTQGVGGLGMAGLYMGGKMFGPEIKRGLTGLFNDTPSAGRSPMMPGSGNAVVDSRDLASGPLSYSMDGLDALTSDSPLTYDLGADYSTFDPGGLTDVGGMDFMSVDPYGGLGGFDWLTAMDPYRWSDWT